MTRIAPFLAACAAITAVPLSAQRTAAPPTAGDAKVAALRDKALTDDTAYEIVEGLTTEVGPRMTGTEAAPRARAWSVARLKAMGFKNVRIEPYQLPVWSRGTESATLVAPYAQTLHVVGLGNSGATPAGGLTLPIVYFPT